MAPSRTGGWQEESYGQRIERSVGTHEEERRHSRVVGELKWPGFEFIDPVAHNEGKLVGYFLDVPYDWSLCDPDLIWRP